MGSPDAVETESVNNNGHRAGNQHNRSASSAQGLQGECGTGHNQDELQQAQHGEAQRRGEKQDEILGPAFAKLGEAAVHAGANGVGAVAEEDLAPGLLNVARQSDVLEQADGDGSVSTNSL